MRALEPRPAPSLDARPDQPLIGIIVQQDGQEVVRYFADEAAADAAQPDDAIQDALNLAGAWSDLDWDEMVEALERIRHESRPTPAIDLDL